MQPPTFGRFLKWFSLNIYWSKLCINSHR